MPATPFDQARLFDPGPAAPAEDSALDALFERASSYFSLLAEPSRLRILRVICFEECSVQQVVERTGLPQPNVSRHLALLNRSGVLSRRRSGTSVFYAVSDPTIIELCRLVCVRLASGMEATG
ncbi:MAG: winged helix-turn-helix transcriptional regulator [Burkholderiaceae bacterium]|nr:winged helix-turn-helix transcriptional regulator [Burkholderiaceae bacterium]